MPAERPARRGPHDPVIGLLLAIGLLTGLAALAGAGPVAIEPGPDGWRLLRDGEPYFVKGAGGSSRLDLLAASGGNSIRTWGADDAGEVLDRAHANGISVTLGIWIGHPRHGFDYGDRDAVERQREMVREVVRAHKDHPALLMWGVGNEVELNSDPDLVFPEINRLARIVKEIDDEHPTMAVLAGAGEDKVRSFMRHCPDIDVLGVNAYKEAPDVPGVLRRLGYDGPFLLTEYGATGHWQVDKAPWGAAIEPTSTEKGRTYQDAYRRGVLGHPERCLGSYVFFWGQKQEVTPTWYGMFLPSGETTPTLDAMHRVWSGTEPDHAAPAVGAIASPVALRRVGRSMDTWAEIDASDADGDDLTYSWSISRESTAAHVGGDREYVPDAFPELILERGPRARIRTPEEPGAYRLFVTVTDGTGRAGTANIPFYVE
jgi:hypothetical protein